MNGRPWVVKVGGSLLEWPGLADRLAVWIPDQNRPMVLIAGGGTIVDAIRRADAIHRLGEERSHWLAIRALDLTARILADSCRLGPVVRSPRRGLKVGIRTRPAVLAPFRFLKRDEARPGALPHSWEVTSDSIAARLAQRLDARLILLKSVAMDGASTIDQAAQMGWVDPVFPAASAGLRSVWYQNFRDPESVPERLPPSASA